MSSQATITACTSKHTSYIPLVVLIVAQIGTTCDNAAMNIAVSDLSNQLAASFADIQVANTIYSLVAGALMLAGGLLGITFGWRKIMRIGLAFALIGEIVGMIAPTMGVFIWGGRLVVGLGVSLIIPAVLGFVPALYEGRQRAIAFGSIAGAAALSTLSPLVLGVLVDTGGFRVTFGSMGLYFLVVLVATLFLPRGKRASTQSYLDIVGMVLAVVGLGLVLLGVSGLSTWGIWTAKDAAPISIGGVSPAAPMVAVGIIVLVLLLFVERRAKYSHDQTLIPLSFLKTPAIRSGLVAIGLPFFFMGAQGMIIMPYLQLVAGFSAAQSGLISLLPGIPMFVLASTISKFAPHLSSRFIIRSGFGLLICSSLVMAAGIVDNGITPLLFVGVCLGGFGVGAINSQANNAVASAVHGRDAQQSGGVQGAARNIGIALGTALAGSVLLLALEFGMTHAPLSLNIPNHERTEIIDESSSIMTSQSFEQIMAPFALTADEQSSLVAAKTTAQTNAERVTFLFLGLVMVFGLLGTRHLIETADAPVYRVLRKKTSQ